MLRSSSSLAIIAYGGSVPTAISIFFGSVTGLLRSSLQAFELVHFIVLHSFHVWGSTPFVGLSVSIHLMLMSPLREANKITEDSVSARIVSCLATRIVACLCTSTLENLCDSMLDILDRSLSLPKICTDEVFDYTEPCAYYHGSQLYDQWTAYFFWIYYSLTPRGLGASRIATFWVQP